MVCSASHKDSMNSNEGGSSKEKKNRQKKVER